MTTKASRPRKGTRPANRQELIVAAAADLFRTRGYEHVGMSDIADAVAVGPSALYRHFPGKQELLKRVVFDGLGAVEALLGETDLSDPATALPVLAEVTIANRHVGILLERESRHLPEPDQEELAAEIDRIVNRLTALVQSLRPKLSLAGARLIAWVMLAVFTSPSFHHPDMTVDQQVSLLAAVSERVLWAPVPSDYRATRRRRQPAGLLPHSRREALLQQAIKLFAERRYASVGVEDVAASLGIAGPSVYNHFPSKVQLLVTALQRGTAYLYMQLADVLAAASSPDAALRGLIDSYIAFALEHPALVDIMITEVRNLPEPHHEIALADQRNYIDEWTYLLRDAQPALSSAEARVEVQAVLTVANYIARVPHLTGADNIAATVAGICQRMLSVTP